MRWLNAASLALTIVMLAACGNHSGQTAGETPEDPVAVYAGHVVQKSGESILVTTNRERNFGAGGASHYYRAIWFSNAGEAPQVGDWVEVRSSGPIAESYPEQGRADEVAVIAADQPEGAVLQVSEAIRRALISPEIADVIAPAVTSVVFEPAAAEWQVEIAQNGKEETVSIRIPDGEEDGAGANAEPAEPNADPFGEDAGQPGENAEPEGRATT
ncbi:DUF3221 domain-containing protein [Paenibacillaceae bacterium WGS1546]|uniref:DUF3221 domain-containing protein n=1 Tax=Cohnella sp. WGS1546 TaxID=3366810 RepID=UPI00372D28D4